MQTRENMFYIKEITSLLNINEKELKENIAALEE